MNARRTTALATSLFLAAGSVSAQLPAPPQSLGPLGGSATSVVVDPDSPLVILVIKYTQGLFRSTDGGATFLPFGSGIGGNIRNLTQDPRDNDTLFVLEGTQIFRSTDFGANWSPLGLVSNENLKNVAVPTSGTNLLAADAFNIYHSDDDGATWSVADSTVPFAGGVFDNVAFSPSDPSVAYHAYNDGVKRSTDGGASFVQTGPFDEWVQAFTVSPTDPDLLFAGTPFNGVFRSTDGGANFTSLGAASPDGNSEFFRWEPATGRLWYATLTATFFSDDTGLNWNQALGFPSNQPIPLDLTFNSLGWRYLGTEGGGLNNSAGGGLYRMVPPETEWTHIAFLEVAVQDVAVAGPGGERIAAFGNGVYAGDPGETVTPTAWVFDIGVDTRTVAVDPDDPTRWVTGGVGAFFDNAQVAVLTQGGDQFVKTFENLGSGVVEDLEFDPHDSDVMLGGMSPAAFGNPAIIRSTDRGENWSQIPGTAGWATQAIAFDPITQGRVLQLSENNQWSGSLNGGSNWIPLQPAWPGTGPGVLLEFDPFAPEVLYRGDAGDGLWRSDDLGDNWTNLGVPLTTGSAVYLHPQFPDLMWVSDGNGEILVSADRGDTFATALAVPLGANATALDLDLSDGTLLFGTDGSSAWQLPSASPYVKLGDGTEGSGGFVPRHFAGGGLPTIGNAAFTLGGDRIVGGGFVLLAVGLSEIQVPILGGTLFVGTLALQLGGVADGAAGVGGVGGVAIPLPLPSDVTFVGVPLVSQYGVVDFGGSNPLGIVLSDGLRTTIQP